MAETLRSDGKAIDVTAPNAGCTKGQPILAEGFHGIAMATAASGETVAIEIATREHELNVGSVTAAKGDILYLSSSNVITNTNTDRAFCKVTVAKDSNNIAWVVLLPQGAESV